MTCHSLVGSKFWASLCCAVVVLTVGGTAKAAPKDYEKSAEVSGTVISIGSDTLANLMDCWSESFKKLHPNVTFQIESKGSNTAPAALTEGSAMLGPMSRAMETGEEDAFEAKHGFKPTRVRCRAGLHLGLGQQGQSG